AVGSEFNNCGIADNAWGSALGSLKRFIEMSALPL
ncbi:MAG: hypothetical protein QOG73_1738, partial [Acetobacteraceae bacterium]|nr:hypothetical protein [Acetobacteraceae bacterium]